MSCPRFGSKNSGAVNHEGISLFGTIAHVVLASYPLGLLHIGAIAPFPHTNSLYEENRSSTQGDSRMRFSLGPWSV